MVDVEDARKAVQLIQYSILGLTEIILSDEKIEDNEGLLMDAATTVLQAACVLDLYLTKNSSVRRDHATLDAHKAVRFVSLMEPFSLSLSIPEMVLKFSWPREGVDIFQLEGNNEDVRSRWTALFGGAERLSGEIDPETVREKAP